MKRNVKKILLRIASSTTCLLLATAIALPQAKDVVGYAKASMTVSGTLTDVTGQYSTDGIRKEYFNENVQKNKLSGTDERWIIVGFEGNSVIDNYYESQSSLSFSEYAKSADAERTVQALEDDHNKFLKQLNEKGIDYEYKYSYSTLNNGVAIKVQRKDIATVSKMAGVVDVEYSESYAVPKAAVSNNANVYTTGIYNTDGIDYTGAGMKVAVLDTGLDFSHPAFCVMPEDESLIWHEEDIQNNLSKTEAYTRSANLSVDQVYYNTKVPFAYDYADNDPDVYPSYSDHGTHVAGIIAGRDDSKFVNEDKTETFVGVAPEAQLIICKVFTDNLDSDMLGGADTVDILAALADCATLGVDVINMSLGSSCGFSTEDKEVGGFIVSEVYSKIEELGISLVVAASNDSSSGYGGGNGTNLASNPDSGTVGSPGTYSASLTVASINGKEATYVVANQKSPDDEENVAFITESADANGNDYNFMEQLYEKTKTPKDQKLTLNYVVVGGVGNPANYTSTVKRELAKGNTIALVKRGDITFAEKVENAMMEGALACIIYNNVSGTIKMSLGEVEDPIPTCSIGMDAGKILVDGAKKGVGTITFSYDYKAGPFMSDFSSWGPTPDLKLKPEISAHGGEIMSAVPGGYDELSGTSMAAPNMAGAIALLRQHISKTYGLTGWELNAMVNRFAMSATTMALNDEGNPYSPRKQGAGLASIADAINTQGYISVKDENGNISNKTKIELGDDDDRTGVYTLNFTVNNLVSDKALVYKPNVYVMTETLATDLKTVAEKAYMLEDSVISMVADGQSVAYGDNITVPAGGTLDLSVTIKLGKAGRQYLEDSFKNGMYIEGYVRLQPVETATVEIGLPYLGFYGDWADAPLFDYSMYELAVTDADPSIEEEDKPKASAASSKPLGLFDDDQYIIPLGSYLYTMAEDETEVYPSTDKAAVSMFDYEGRRTIYEMYMVYAGLLRGAKTLDVEIKDKTTGELIYSKVEKNVRKSYAAGGSNIGAPIMFEINPNDWDMFNNMTYVVSMQGDLDCEGGENPENDTFTFEFTVDTESPVIREYRIRFEPYTENKEVKYRIYMDVDVYDNQYSMTVMPCYIKEEKGERQLTLLSEYPIPTYSQKGTEKTVSFEITDYYEQFVQTGEMYLSVEDYAMNQTVYQVNAPASTTYPTEVSLNCDDKLTLKETGATEANADGTAYNVYEINLAPNEVYGVSVDSSISGELVQSLVWRSSSENVKAEKSELFALTAGESTIDICKAYNSGEKDEENTYIVLARILVKVEGAEKAAPLAESIGFKPVLVGTNYLVDPDKVGSAGLEFRPNKTIQFEVEADPWYVPLELEWRSSNEAIFTVDENGLVTTKKKGTARLEVSAKGYDRLKKSVKIVVGEEFYIVSYRLYDYYGGPEVIIPDDKNIMYLDKECFQNNTEITKVVLPTTLMEISENAFEGCTSLEEVVIPGKCTVIQNYAFKGCTSLKKITLLESEDKVNGDKSTGAITVGRSTFEGCTSLTTIENPSRLTTAYDNAFKGCTALEEIDINGLRIAGKNVFEGCTNLKKVITDADTPLGAYMFKNCTSLESFEIKAQRINDGLFSGCSALSSVTFSAETVYYMGAKAFSGTALTTVTLPKGDYQVGANAFADCTKFEKLVISKNANVTFGGAPFGGCTAFDTIEVEEGNTKFAVEDNVLYNADKTVLQLVPIGLEGSVEIADNITEIGSSVFVGTSLTTIALNNVTKIGSHAFADSAIETLDLSNVTEIGAYAFEGSSLKTIDLTGITEIKDGTFKDCKSLTTVTGLAKVTSIGAEAFKGCNALAGDSQRLVMTKLMSVGDHAFEGSSIRRMTAKELTSIGEYAFAETSLTKVEFPAVEKIGAYAFYNVYNLEEASFGGVTEMGERAFAIELTEDEQNTSIKVGRTFTFGDGTTEIGAYAFLAGSLDENGNISSYYPGLLRKVELPNSVKKIGDNAFMFSAGLQAINLSGVEEIGAYAFYMTGIESADLSSIRNIGNLAFCEAANLKNVTLGNFEWIGKLAFAQTAITTLEIPNISDLTFDESWFELDDGGNWVEVTGKKTARIAAGAFGGISTLKTVKVKGEGKLSVIDNVLYMDTAEGKVLLLYPSNRAGSEYTPVQGTVRIGDYAFYNTFKLEKVTIPYTVKAIGSYAFFNDLDELVDENEELVYPDVKIINEFIFNGVEAPVLEASYHEVGYSIDEGVDEDGNPTMYLTEFCGWAQGLFYTNFKGYFHDVVDPSTLKPTEESKDFALKISYPANGVGYNSPIWTNFFKEVEKTDYAAEYNTQKTIEAIAALPELSVVEEALASGTADEKYAAIQAISETYVQPTRKLYNGITSVQQLALVTEYDELLAMEKAIRDAKKTIGREAQITSFEIVQNPTKTKYVGGENFDNTGMIVKVVYDDMSEVEVTDYTVDKEVLYAPEGVNPVVDITLSYQGKTCTLSVVVEGGLKEPEVVDPITPPDSSVDGGEDQNAPGAGIIIGVICGVVVLAGAAVAVFFVLKKKKAANVSVEEAVAEETASETQEDAE